MCSCAKNEAADIIGKPEISVEDGRFTPELLWALGRMGEMTVSPNGGMIAYTLAYTDMKANASNAELYLMDTAGGDGVRLTETPESEFNPVWMDDVTLLFCRGDELRSIDIRTHKENLLATVPDGIEGFKLAPDGRSIVYISTIPIRRPQHLDSLYEGLDKSTGRINEGLMYRHWDEWVDAVPQLFLAWLDGTLDVEHATRIIDSTYECPLRPFGGIEQFNFSPDSKQIAYTCKKKTGMDYAISTNSDIYLYDIEHGTTRNLSEGNMGYDQNPVFSHDGTMLAWESMERDGYESDKQRLHVMHLASGEITDLTPNFDYSVNALTWTDDDSHLLALVPYRGTEQVFLFGFDGTHEKVTTGYHNITSYELVGDKLIASQTSMQYPNEIYAYKIGKYLNSDGPSAAMSDPRIAQGDITSLYTECTGELGSKLSTYNDELLSQLKMGRVEPQWISTVDNQQMLVWLIYPYNYDSTKTYPALLYCEGGPQSMVGQFWSLRWNFEVMSGAGYFVIAPNRRGCVGFGSEWCEEVSGDYGGLCMDDYHSALRYFTRTVPQIDSGRIGACGASFGGFSIYWLAGHNDDHAIKAFLAHNGMFNLEQESLETEELFCDNWEYGGHYWDPNPRVRASYAQSPHRFVDRWSTPICVIHSERDYRIVASQGMAAYNAAKLRGLDARYLYFPDETHWVQKPQNSLLWHRNFIDWFDSHLK